MYIRLWSSDELDTNERMMVNSNMKLCVLHKFFDSQVFNDKKGIVFIIVQFLVKGRILNHYQSRKERLKQCQFVHAGMLHMPSVISLLLVILLLNTKFLTATSFKLYTNFGISYRPEFKSPTKLLSYMSTNLRPSNLKFTTCKKPFRTITNKIVTSRISNSVIRSHAYPFAQILDPFSVIQLYRCWTNRLLTPAYGNILFMCQIPDLSVVNSSNNSLHINSSFADSAVSSSTRELPYITSEYPISPNLPEVLDLTTENVEMILDRDIRPYLIADGGNCTLIKIENNIVYIKLEGACGNCASSVVTLKIGIERKLKEVFSKVIRVEPVSDEGDQLTEYNIEKVLDGIRPFLRAMGSDVIITKLVSPSEGIGRTLLLKHVKAGEKESISEVPLSIPVKLEISQRLRKKFPTLSDIYIS